MAITREEFIRRAAANIFWTDMARKPEDRTPLDTESANELLCSCLFNRGIPWSLAMSIVTEMKRRTGYTDTLLMLTELSSEMLEWVMFDDDTDCSAVGGRSGSLHRYRYMAGLAHGLGMTLKSEFEGSAMNLWKDEPTGAQLLARVMDFKGIGAKIGSLFVRIVVLSHGVQLWDTYASMEVSPDRHVQRVMQRLGLIGQDATPKQVIEAARMLSPMCPCEVDGFFCVGLDWCHASRQECHGNTNEEGGTEREECPLLRVCSSAR